MLYGIRLSYARIELDIDHWFELICNLEYIHRFLALWLRLLQCLPVLKYIYIATHPNSWILNLFITDPKFVWSVARTTPTVDIIFRTTPPG